MKFFSRKALVAAAAAATISFGGAGAAMAQDTPAPSTPATSTPATTKANEGSSFDGLSSSKGDNLDKDMEVKPENIKDWIGVFTAVITALSALFAFVNKYLKF